VLTNLSEKEVDLEGLAQRASEDPAFLARLVEGLSDRQERVGYNCLRTLLLVAEERPELLYPYWDVFVGLLRADNTYFKLRGANLIAAVVTADEEHRFEDIFDDYYALLDGKSVIAACYVAGNSGSIARAKPHLQARITARLLGIDDTHHPPQRRDLIKGHAVEAFGEYAEQSGDKGKILEFIQAQLDSESPRTRKVARELLQRWGDPV
jgi:hypothetical protein